MKDVAALALVDWAVPFVVLAEDAVELPEEVPDELELVPELVVPAAPPPGARLAEALAARLWKLARDRLAFAAVLQEMLV